MVSRAWVRILMAVLLLAGMLVTVLPDLGQAEEPASMTDAGQQTTLLGPFSLQAGYKTWYAQWQSRSIISNATGSNQQTSSFAPMTGPLITLGYTRRGSEDWFRGLYVSYQYLNGGFGYHDYGSTGTQTVPAIQTALRTDTTISASIPVYKGYGVFGGFYESLQRFQFSKGTPRQASLRFKGPVAGLFGSEPVTGTRAALYGNVGVGWLTLHPGQSDGQGTNAQFGTESVMMYSMESGVNYGLPGFWKIRPSVQIGFRAQVLQQTFPRSFPAASGNAATNLLANTRTNDIMWGPTFMVSAAF